MRSVNRITNRVLNKHNMQVYLVIVGKRNVYTDAGTPLERENDDVARFFIVDDCDIDTDNFCDINLSDGTAWGRPVSANYFVSRILKVYDDDIDNNNYYFFDNNYIYCTDDDTDNNNDDTDNNNDNNDDSNLDNFTPVYVWRQDHLSKILSMDD
jgi:hypothetical protein